MAALLEIAGLSDIIPSAPTPEALDQARSGHGARRGGRKTVARSAGREGWSGTILSNAQ